MTFQFTCPLQGCNNTVMTSNAQNSEEGAAELTNTAEKHLAAMHPDVHKTHEEVDADIHAHMVSAN